METSWKKTNVPLRYMIIVIVVGVICSEWIRGGGTNNLRGVLEGILYNLFLFTMVATAFSGLSGDQND